MENSDYYFKELELPEEEGKYGILYSIFLILLGIVVIAIPDFGIWIGLILMAWAVIKVIGLSKDYGNILLIFLLGLFIAVLSGYSVGEYVMGAILIFMGVIPFLKR